MYIQLVEYHDHWEQNDAPADIVERFSAFQDITDKYIYLLLMYQTWQDCSKDILSNRVENRFAFWKTTKCLLNYVNAIYSIKEFIENYDGKKSVIYAPMDEAFLPSCLDSCHYEMGICTCHYDLLLNHTVLRPGG